MSPMRFLMKQCTATLIFGSFVDARTQYADAIMKRSLARKKRELEQHFQKKIHVKIPLSLSIYTDIFYSYFKFLLL